MLKEIADRLKTLNIPLAYKKFSKEQALPYCVYYVDNERIYGGDDINLFTDSEVIIELYTEKKDMALEARLEALFPDMAMLKYEIDLDGFWEEAYHINITDRRI